jgi:glutamyl-tRNA synthetase
MLDAKELSRYVGFADDDIGEVAKIFLDEVSTLKELRAKIEPIFAKKEIPEEFHEAASKMQAIIKDAPHFEEFEAFKSYIMENSGLKGKNFFKPLRLLLTGAEHGPELADIYPHLKNYIKEIIK